MAPHPFGLEQYLWYNITMQIDIFLSLGIMGMLMILGGFLLIQTHKLTSDSLLYDVLNFVGSTLLVISAWPARQWPFIILNGVFALYSLKDILFIDLRREPKIVRKA